MESIQEQVFAYVKKQYRVAPDYPFPMAPSCPVLRHGDNRKLFALMMELPRSRLGLEGEERVAVLNLKCSAALSGVLRQQEGILPAYHMHRDSWISVLLDGTVPLEDILPLVDLSFSLTADPKSRKNPAHWLVPANPRYYDLDAVIAASPDGSFLWKQSSQVKVGDWVYLYVTAPVSAVSYCCRVTEADIPYSFRNAQVHMEKVMRLQVKKRYRKPLGREELRRHGVSTVRGPRHLPESLLEELKNRK